jgi:AcrR family transcriptional regulator
MTSARGRRPADASSRRRYDVEGVLAAAVQVFTERGYDGTSMDDLSKAIGLSKSSLYHHIEGKEHLLRLALERAVEPLHAVVEEQAALTGRAVDRLAYVIRREVQVLAEQLPYVTLLLRVHGNTETERWALDQRRAFDKVLTAMVQQAIDEGDLRSDLDATTTARLIFGNINSLIDWYRPQTRKAIPVDDLATRVVSLLFDGLRA